MEHTVECGDGSYWSRGMAWIHRRHLSGSFGKRWKDRGGSVELAPAGEGALASLDEEPDLAETPLASLDEEPDLATDVKSSFASAAVGAYPERHPGTQHFFPIVFSVSTNLSLK